MKFRQKDIKSSKFVLIIIVTAQFFCTSLWFATNGVAEAISATFSMTNGVVTAAVQFGFIAGTLLFAIFKISDRWSPSIVFLICALLGSGSNASIGLIDSYEALLGLRFLTGFFLAGIYPVGMKIASDYHEKGLGIALGFLVGALVVGTALPHLLKDVLSAQPWQWVIFSASGLSIIGGLLVGIFVSDGPYRRAAGSFNPIEFVTIFRNRKFRGAAFGYFGHMWELYAFWAFMPIYFSLYDASVSSMSIFMFTIIGVGGVGCAVGGYASRKCGSKKVAGFSLFASMICCFLSPLALLLPLELFVLFLLIWGVAVITDSPQFSTMVASSAPPVLIGTGLTIVNCIGFALTILSISLLDQLPQNEFMFIWLGIGPAIGLIYFLRNA